MTIAEALATLSVPVTHPPFMGETDEYITYQMASQQGILYADGAEAETGVSYVVDYYTKNPPFSAMIKDIKRLLAAADWTCEVAVETYEEDTGFYHISMTATAAGEIYG